MCKALGPYFNCSILVSSLLNRMGDHRNIVTIELNKKHLTVFSTEKLQNSKLVVHFTYFGYVIEGFCFRVPEK